MTYTVRIKHAGADADAAELSNERDAVELSYERYSDAAREFWHTVAMQPDDGWAQPRDAYTHMYRSGIDADGNRWHVSLFDGRDEQRAVAERLTRSMDDEIARRNARDTKEGS